MIRGRWHAEIATGNIIRSVCLNSLVAASLKALGSQIVYPHIINLPLGYIALVYH